jgi:hypothetical protein
MIDAATVLLLHSSKARRKTFRGRKNGIPLSYPILILVVGAVDRE